MALVYGQETPPRGQVSSAPYPVAPVPPSAFTAQAAYGAPLSNQMDKLTQALMQARLRSLLAGKLPGTTPQSLGSGTGMSDAGSATAPPPLSLGGPTSADA
jgi:hypothetical protein